MAVTGGQARPKTDVKLDAPRAFELSGGQEDGAAGSETNATPGRRRSPLRGHLILALVFFGALALRCTYLWGQAQNNPLFDHPTMDALVHHEWAQRIASGEGMGDEPYFRAPLYYYSLGMLYRVCGPNVALARLAGCVLGAATCYLVARLGMILGGFGVGALAGIIAAVYWPFIYFDGELLTVGLEIFLDVGLLLVLTLAGRRASLALFLAAGAVWGLSAIARPNVLAFAPAVVAWLWIAVPEAGRAIPRFRAGVLTFAGAALVILPVAVRNYVVAGEPVLVTTSGGVNFFIGNNPGSTGTSAAMPGARPGLRKMFEDTRRIAERDLGRKVSASEEADYWYAKAFAWIRSNPLAWSKLMLRKLRFFWSPLELGNNLPITVVARLSAVSVLFWVGFPVVACLGVGGMVLLREQWRTWFLPAAFLVIYMATVVSFFCNARYRLPVVPALILFAAAGALRFVESLRRRRFNPAAAYLGVALVAAVVLATNPPQRDRARTMEEAVWHSRLGGHYGRPAPEGPGDWVKAAEHFRKAIELAPDYWQYPLLLGQVLTRMNKRDEAEKVFAAAVARYPLRAEARVKYAQVLVSGGKFDEALEQYQAALALRSTYAEAHTGMGCALVSMGRNKEAIKHLRAALAIQPKLTRAQRCLEVALQRRGARPGPGPPGP